ncbi:hypothetical protein ACEWY4_011665 [Coilia grayii]|uniref:ribonuclease H n=1 Tax=Coilia grayii TaxID=363190 RepID=A0ABD1JYE0_9TELE
MADNLDPISDWEQRSEGGEPTDVDTPNVRGIVTEHLRNLMPQLAESRGFRPIWEPPRRVERIAINVTLYLGDIGTTVIPGQDKTYWNPANRYLNHQAGVALALQQRWPQAFETQKRSMERTNRIPTEGKTFWVLRVNDKYATHCIQCCYDPAGRQNATQQAQTLNEMYEGAVRATTTPDIVTAIFGIGEFQYNIDVSIRQLRRVTEQNRDKIFHVVLKDALLFERVKSNFQQGMAETPYNPEMEQAQEGDLVNPIRETPIHRYPNLTPINMGASPILPTAPEGDVVNPVRETPTHRYPNPTPINMGASPRLSATPAASDERVPVSPVAPVRVSPLRTTVGSQAEQSKGKLLSTGGVMGRIVRAPLDEIPGMGGKKPYVLIFRRQGDGYLSKPIYWGEVRRLVGAATVQNNLAAELEYNLAYTAGQPPRNYYYFLNLGGLREKVSTIAVGLIREDEGILDLESHLHRGMNEAAVASTEEGRPARVLVIRLRNAGAKMGGQTERNFMIQVASVFPWETLRDLLVPYVILVQKNEHEELMSEALLQSYAQYAQGQTASFEHLTRSLNISFPEEVERPTAENRSATPTRHWLPQLVEEIEPVNLPPPPPIQPDPPGIQSDVEWPPPLGEPEDDFLNLPAYRPRLVRTQTEMHLDRQYPENMGRSEERTQTPHPIARVNTTGNPVSAEETTPPAWSYLPPLSVAPDITTNQNSSYTPEGLNRSRGTRVTIRESVNNTRRTSPVDPPNPVPIYPGNSMPSGRYARGRVPRAKAVNLKPYRPDRPPALPPVWRTEDGGYYNPTLEGRPTGPIQHHHPMPVWYDCTSEERQLIPKSPSSRDVYEMEGVGTPWKNAYVAAGYDYYRQGCIRRDRSVERYSQHEDDQEEDEVDIREPMAYSTPKREEEDLDRYATREGSRRHDLSPLRTQQRGRMSRLYESSLRITATEIIPDRESDESDLEYLHKCLEQGLTLEDLDEPEMITLMRMKSRLQIPKGWKISDLMRTTVHPPGVDKIEDKITKLVEDIRKGKTNLQIGMQSLVALGGSQKHQERLLTLLGTDSADRLSCQWDTMTQVEKEIATRSYDRMTAHKWAKNGRRPRNGPNDKKLGKTQEQSSGADQLPVRHPKGKQQAKTTRRNTSLVGHPGSTQEALHDSRRVEESIKRGERPDEGEAESMGRQVRTEEGFSKAEDPITAIVRTAYFQDGLLRAKLPTGEEFIIDTGAEISVDQITEEHKFIAKGMACMANGEEVMMEFYQRPDGMTVMAGKEKLLGISDITRAVNVRYMKEINNEKEMDRIMQNTRINNKDRLKQILNTGKYAKFKNDCGYVKDYVYMIKGIMPGTEKQYPLGKGQEEILKTIKELESIGVVKRVENPPCILPIQAVPKPDGTYRLVHNLKELNRRTEKDVRILLDPQEAVRTAKTGRYKTCIDLANGFWSVPLDEMSMLKTCFMVNRQAYCWTRLPQGYVNSPNVFQSLVESTLEGLDLTVYIDDIYFCHDDEEEHLFMLEEVISRLTKRGFLIGLKKCTIGEEKCKYLGFEITDEGRQIHSEYFDSIPIPTDLIEAERVMGKLEYVAAHIPQYASLARPGHALKKGMRIRGERGKLKTTNRPLTEQEKDTIKEIIKKAKATQIILTTRINNTPLRVELLISKEGGTMMAFNSTDQTPCMMKSMKFTPTELKYSPIEQYLCVAFKYYRFLRNAGNPPYIIYVTTYPMLKEVSKGSVEATKALGSRWGKWQIMLSDDSVYFQHKYTLKEVQAQTQAPDPQWVIYTDGSKRTTEDFAKWAYLAKDLTTGKSVVSSGIIDESMYNRDDITAQLAEVTAVVEALAFADKRKIKKLKIVTDSRYVEQAMNEELPIWEGTGYKRNTGKDLKHQTCWKIIATLRKGKEVSVEHIHSHTDGDSAHHIGNREVDAVAQARSLILHQHIIFPKAWENEQGYICVPEDESKHYIKAFHELLGHIGLARLRIRLKEAKVIIKRLKDVFQEVKTQCEGCQVKGGTRKADVKDLPIAVPDPGEHYSADIAYMTPIGEKRNKYALVVVDNAGGDGEMFPLRVMTASNIAQGLCRFFSSRKTAKSLRTDNAMNFRGNPIQRLLEQLGIKHVASIPYKSNTNGVAERAIRTIKELISADLKTKWDTPLGILALNRHVSLPNLKPHRVLKDEKGNTHPFKEGDTVWHKNKTELTLKTVTKIEGNKITLNTGEIVHPHQINIRKKDD